MVLREEKVKELAAWARLELSPEETTRFTRQINDLLSYVEKIKEVPVEGVEPTIHILPLNNVFREDQVRPSLDKELVLANAPQQERGFFRVPRILEES